MDCPIHGEPTQDQLAARIRELEAELAAFELDSNRREETFARKIGEQQARAETAEAENKALRERRGVTVRPLEWRDSYGVLRAETPFGDYMVTRKVVKMPVTSRAEMVSDDPTAAAQADYERRILSALSPAPASVGEAKIQEAASKALFGYMDRSDRYAQGVCTGVERTTKALRVLSEGEG